MDAFSTELDALLVAVAKVARFPLTVACASEYAAAVADQARKHAAFLCKWRAKLASAAPPSHGIGCDCEACRPELYE